MYSATAGYRFVLSRGLADVGILTGRTRRPVGAGAALESKMKFLCLAYGDEAGWNRLSASRKEEVLAADAAIRARGALMSAVQPEVHTVTNWDGHTRLTDTPYAKHALPLAGFSVIEAESVEEVIRLVEQTPCARADGYIEIRALWETSAG
ncbi:MAG: transcription initiation protein [Proteobacteria bacterium]|nr:transcription initiation protein [Pseudomonadota bacterium]